MHHHLADDSHTIDIETFHAHLIHQCWDVLNGELVLLLLQRLDVRLCILDLFLHRAELSNQVAESLTGLRVYISKRTGFVEDVIKDISHKFVLFRVACGQLVC